MPAKNKKNPTAVRLGARLKEIRKAKGFTLQQLGDIVGVHRQRIFDVEAGEFNVRVGNYDRILDALDCELTISRKFRHL